MRKPGFYLAAFIILISFTRPASAQPFFSKSFVPATIGPGSISTLTFVIDNIERPPATDLAFTDNLPAGLVIATPANAMTTCTNGVLTAPEGGATITFSGGNLPSNSVCSITVNVTGGSAGVYTNTSGDLTSSEGNSGNTTADLTISAGLPGFSKSFSPSSIPVGHTSTLTFTVNNTANAAAAAQVSFTDALPPGLLVASPANAAIDCAGTLTAVPGTGVVSLVNGFVPASSSCTVTVNVIGITVGMKQNVTGPLTSSLGTSGSAGATLDVRLDPLIKTFTNDPAPPGGTVTLEFTITNLDRTNDATNISFTDDLDATLSGLTAVGLPMANPCGAGSQLTGTGLLTLTGASLSPGSSCTFSVTLQVPAGAASGTYPNTTSTMTMTVGGAPVVENPASDDLIVQPVPLLTKTFTDDPVVPGGTATLEFTITNTDPANPATAITFTDNFDALIPGLVSTLPPAGFCGAGSSITLSFPEGPGTSGVLRIFNASLAAGASCTFSITLQLPPDVPAGTYPNTTGDIAALVGGVPLTGPAASDNLTVVAPPQLSKVFTDDPVLPGGIVTLQFTLTSSENASGDATGITFTDDLDATLSGLLAVGLPLNDPCGAGSQLSGTTLLTLTGGSLAPGTSCTFSVPLQVPAAALPGSYANTTSTVAATMLGLSTTGPAASDNLTVGGLSLVKSFTDDPVIPGGTVTLQFTITNSSANLAATNIAFTDNLGSVLSGLSATGLPVSNICGAGSQISQAGSTLTFTGGNLLAGASCVFSVTLTVPGAAASGEYTNTTSAMTADMGGSTVVVDPAVDALQVTTDFLALAKTFTTNPVVPGATATLQFTVTNLNPSLPATNIAFTDDLGAALTGLAATGLPLNNICGTGSQLSGTSLLMLTGGNLPAGGSCTFSVSLQVPDTVPPGTTAVNTTSQAAGQINSLPVTGNPATDTLRIDAVSLAKAFSGPAFADGTVNLSFTIQNLNTTTAAADLAFSDDLGAVLPGLVATGLPQTNVCGTGSQLSGTSFLTLTGGSLAPGASCAFNVTLKVPAAAAPGSYPNTTSALFSGGNPFGTPAAATLSIEPPPLFSKSFAPNSILFGGVSTLTFTIDNSASALAATGLSFTDNLPAGMLVAAPANASTTCTGGTLTAVSGSGVITYSGGTVAAGSSCTVRVDVTSSAAGVHVNTTGLLTSAAGSSGTATASFTVGDQPPALAKAFGPGTIIGGGISTLTFTIDNTAASVAATGIGFTDNLPAGMVVATPANASTTCTGGTLTAVSGSGVITYNSGTVAAGSSCTVSADVTAAAPGTYVNTTGSLSSSLGISGTASDTLQVNAQAAVAIPAINGWGMIVFMLAAGLASISLLRKRGRKIQR
jgi:uncharacterized repeat protein (TIGR01451 family)